MQLHLKQLATHLKPLQQMPLLYFLHGDELLLLQETKEQLREKATALGFTQIERININSDADWNHFVALTKNQSLFAEQQFIEIHNPAGKWPEKETVLLLDYLAIADKNTTLVVSSPKLTAAQQKTKWYKTIAEKGVVIPIWPLTGADFQQWLQTRLKKFNLSAAPESIKLLSDLTEGNLLAAQQAVEKLHLLYPNGSIQPKQINMALADNSRFQIYDLTNYALQGNTARVVHIINHLQHEGEEPTLILWVLCREIRTLIALREEVQRGVSIDQALSKEWQNRKPLLKMAHTRHSLKTLHALLTQAANIDQLIKGIKTGNVWEALCRLSIAFSSPTVFSARKVNGA